MMATLRLYQMREVQNSRAKFGRSKASRLKSGFCFTYKSQLSWNWYQLLRQSLPWDSISFLSFDSFDLKFKSYIYLSLRLIISWTLVKIFFTFTPNRQVRESYSRETRKHGKLTVSLPARSRLIKLKICAKFLPLLAEVRIEVNH